VTGFPHPAGTTTAQALIPDPLTPSPPPLRALAPTSAGPRSASQSCAGWPAPRVLVGKGRRV